MQVDESYAEYVAARWSTLYRLAALLAGEERADDLAQEALVRAYLTWSREPDADPPDERVKAILARVAVTAAPTPAPVPPVVDGLWPRLEALPQRERVVLVLRCFDYLSEADVARALGCRRAVVEADQAAGLAALGSSAEEVTSALTAAAEDVAVPLPPVPALLARGHEARRRRARRAFAWVGVAAVVLVLGLGIGSFLQAHPLFRSGSSTPSSRPLPAQLADLRTGEQPRTAYAELLTLHVPGGRTVTFPAAPTAIVKADNGWYLSFTSGTILRLDDETLDGKIVTSTAAGPVVADRLGRYVAWVDASPGAPLVVVQPTDPRQTHSSRRERRFPTDQPVQVVGITPSGDLVASAPTESQAWVWSGPGEEFVPEEAVHEIDGLGNGVVHQVTPGELVVLYPPSHFAVGRLEGGAFLAEEDVVATNADFADPRNKRIVYSDRAGEIHVGRRGAGTGRDRSHDLRLRLPRLGGGYTGVSWEDDDHVLLDVADDSMPQGALVRCDVDSAACELAARFAVPHLLAR